MPGMVDTIKRLFGGMPAPVTYNDERAPAWPTAEDVAAAQKYDLSYGNPVAAYVQPRNQVSKVIPDRAIVPAASGVMPQYSSSEQAYYDRKISPPGQPSVRATQVSPAVSDQLAQAHLATQKSALAALGFDPRQMTTIEPSASKFRDPKSEWAIGGSTISNLPNMPVFTTGAYPSTIAHESMHRGLELLTRMGMVPKSANEINLLGQDLNKIDHTRPGYEMPSDPNEMVVRALMARNFGPIEMGRGEEGDKQVKEALNFIGKGDGYASRVNENNQILDAIETAAAQAIAKRTPRGPR